MEVNGPKAKNTAGNWVFLFHRVLLMCISLTHGKSIYANEDLTFVLLQKDED